MTLPQLLEMLNKVPAALAQLAAVGAACSAAVGAVGTAVEHAGEALSVPALVGIGQRLEAFGVDFPKLWSGSRFSRYINTKAAKLS